MSRFRLCLMLIGFCVAPLLGGCGGTPSEPTRGYNHLVAASEAITAGDKEKAMTELTAVIDSSPNGWAYFERARLHLEQGKEAEATADCQAGLALEPDNSQLKWLTAELKKPAAQRFKGRFAKPPGLHG